MGENTKNTGRSVLVEELAREVKNGLCTSGRLNAAHDAVMAAVSPDEKFALLSGLAHDAVDAAAAALRAELVRSERRQPPELYLHIKTGGVYEVLCNARAEASSVLLVVYRNVETGERWARPAAEFNDGRFVRAGGLQMDGAQQDEPSPLDEIMEQAQVFASAWSLVGGKFDDGSMLDRATRAKQDLRDKVAERLDWLEKGLAEWRGVALGARAAARAKQPDEASASVRFDGVDDDLVTGRARELMRCLAAVGRDPSDENKRAFREARALLTAPQPAERKSLTDAQILDLRQWTKDGVAMHFDKLAFARAVLRAAGVESAPGEAA